MTPRLLYRTGKVVAASAARTSVPGTVEVSIDAGCAGCAVGCGARAARTVPVAVETDFRPGDRVRLAVTARDLNLRCAAAFGPWLGMVVVLLALAPDGNAPATLGALVAGIVGALALGAWLLGVVPQGLRPRIERFDLERHWGFHYTRNEVGQRR